MCSPFCQLVLLILNDLSSNTHSTPCTLLGCSQTATCQYPFLKTPSFPYLLSCSPCHLISKRNFFLFCPILSSGDVESSPEPTSSIFNVCTSNIKSLTNHLHYTALAYFVETYNNYIFALTETWTSPKSTLAELLDSKPHGFYLVSTPRPVTLLKLLMLVTALHSLFVNHCLYFCLPHLHSSLLKVLPSLLNCLSQNSLFRISIIHLLLVLYHVINLLSPSFLKIFISCINCYYPFSGVSHNWRLPTFMLIILLTLVFTDFSMFSMILIQVSMSHFLLIHILLILSSLEPTLPYIIVLLTSTLHLLTIFLCC
jgi:hypothetical protein